MILSIGGTQLVLCSCGSRRGKGPKHPSPREPGTFFRPIPVQEEGFWNRQRRSSQGRSSFLMDNKGSPRYCESFTEAECETGPPRIRIFSLLSHRTRNGSKTLFTSAREDCTAA